MVEYVAVFVCVAVAAGYLIYTVVQASRGSDTHAGCDGCDVPKRKAVAGSASETHQP